MGQKTDFSHSILVRTRRKWREAGSRYGLTGALLLMLLAMQAVRLIWVVVTPLDQDNILVLHPEPPPVDERIAQFLAYDPFFPASAEQKVANAGPLAFKLLGVSLNEGSGQGSAFLEMPDGQQASFMVGDEIIPGISFKEAAFDHIVITRNGRDELVFQDQSSPAPAADEGNPRGKNATMATDGPLPSADEIRQSASFSARKTGERVSGITVSGQGPAFQASGLIAGDIIVEIEGRPVKSADDIDTLQKALVPGAQLALSIERNGDVIPFTLSIQAP